MPRVRASSQAGGSARKESVSDANQFLGCSQIRLDCAFTRQLHSGRGPMRFIPVSRKAMDDFADGWTGVTSGEV